MPDLKREKPETSCMHLCVVNHFYCLQYIVDLCKSETGALHFVFQDTHMWASSKESCRSLICRRNDWFSSCRMRSLAVCLSVAVDDEDKTSPSDKEASLWRRSWISAS